LFRGHRRKPSRLYRPRKAATCRSTTPRISVRISGRPEESVVLEHAPVDWGGLRFLRSTPRRSSPSPTNVACSLQHALKFAISSNPLVDHLISRLQRSQLRRFGQCDPFFVAHDRNSYVTLLRTPPCTPCERAPRGRGVRPREAVVRPETETLSASRARFLACPQLRCRWANYKAVDFIAVFFSSKPMSPSAL
jgi:hypothetical protein